MPQNTKRFQENLIILLDELNLAKQWKKASILLTVHKSTFSQEKTKVALQNKLENSGDFSINIEANKIGAEFIKFMLSHENRENAVFFISDLERSGGKDGKDAYRALNLYRETFVENGLRAVFFLTEQEASNIPGVAPDFWAFRHRVLEFSSPHTDYQELPSVGLMMWHRDYSALTHSEIKNNIAFTTSLLAETPIRTETAATRTDLHYELGALWWLAGNLAASEEALRTGEKLANRYNFFEQVFIFQNAIAILAYEQGNKDVALEILDPWINKKLQDCILYLNHGIVLLSMNKNYEAVVQGKKAVRLCPENSGLWNSLGFLYFHIGNLEEAILCFRKAIEIFPKMGVYYESLAICYKAMGLTDEALHQLQVARKHTENRHLHHDILEELFFDHLDVASSLITGAVNSGKLFNLDILRDPTLNIAAAYNKS